MTFGFYADGYFDRRPIEQNLINGDLIQYGVTIKSANAAYWGCIFFNGVKSLFFPQADGITVWEEQMKQGYWNILVPAFI